MKSQSQNKELEKINIIDKELSIEKLQKMYSDMLLIRRFEERSAQLYGKGLIAGFCHLYIGQEAVVVGMQASQEKEDAVITAYRDHGHMLAAGMDPKRVMAELTGRQDGYSKGKGGSMHMFSKDANFYGGHGIVGAQIPLGTGLAFAQKYLKKNNITIAYMGDGAANQGQVYESFNMASLWNLPIIYIIENNKYAMGTSTIRSSKKSNFDSRGKSWGIEGKEVNGMDAFEVYLAGKEAREKIIEGKGPQLLVMETYRYRGHSMSDPANYRSKSEVNKIKEEQDPINEFKKKMINEKNIPEENIKKIENNIKTIMKEVVKFAEESKEPNNKELMEDILK